MSTQSNSKTEQTEALSNTDENNSETPRDETTSNSNQNAPQYGYRRVGKTDPTERVVDDLAAIADEFLIDTPPETVGGNINDTDRVRACLNEAIEYFHSNLTDEHRTHIERKWGISDAMINQRKIGFVNDGNGVVEHLENEGFDSITITRAGLGTATTFKHLFECGGVSTENTDFVPEARQDVEVDSDCTHTVDETIETLLRAQLQGLIQPEEIDLQAVAAHVENTDRLNVWNWWDNRITFPYRDETGEFCYLIVRATTQTDDILYNNGITDRSQNKIETVRDTKLGEKILQSETGDAEAHSELESFLEELAIFPHKESVYNTPDEDEHVDAADTAVEKILNRVTDSLHSIGLRHAPDTVSECESTDTAQVHVIDVPDDSDYETDYLLTPPAIGLNPGDNIEFTNHTDADVEINIAGTPDGVWWDNGPVDDLDPMSCDERGMYRYEAHINGDRYNGIIVCYDPVYTDSRNWQVEQWVGDEPGFDVDLAKYIKQTIDRSWINHDAIVEPIFGCETVHEDSPLIVTEGVTDAIVAHQNNLPCVAPATTNFKEHHYEKICELAADVSTVFIVNDNEINNAGVNGALRTAKVIENDGHTVVVGELPRPVDQDKIDVADYLKDNSREAFIANVLQNGIPPAEHDLYDAERHDPEFNTGITTDSNGDFSTSDSDDGDFNADEFDSSNASALYSLSLEDVIDFNALDTGGNSGRTIYRGEHPVQHHGNSTGYFVIRDHGEFITAKDYKIESNGDGYYYNALTWLACAADCDCDPREHCDCTRSPTRPMGSLSNSEIWWSWYHAKTADHIPFPDNDAVPLKAVWFLAEHHDVIPAEFIPDSFDDEQELPNAKFNDVIDIIESEYGIESGRSPLPTTET